METVLVVDDVDVVGLFEEILLRTIFCTEATKGALMGVDLEFGIFSDLNLSDEFAAKWGNPTMFD